jgi:hypothetical protein
MATLLNSNKVLFNKLNHYFKDNIRMSLKRYKKYIIVTKDDLFYCIDIRNDNIPSFIVNDDNSVIQNMIIQDLCHKQINDININECRTYPYGETLYPYPTRSTFLTQSGKVYEANEDEIFNSEKYIHFELKSFKNYSFKNEKIVMISCGLEHSLALTESGRVFGWGDNYSGQLGVDVRRSSEPIIIKLNDLKIQKISCGWNHSLLLSYDGDIYAFGWNRYGEVGNGTRKRQRFPIKLVLNNKFIDIASHPDYEISMSQSIDGIYYVWGLFEGKEVLSPQSTKYQSFENILMVNCTIDNMKTFGKLVEFEDSFLKSGFYSKTFKDIKKLGFGSFGSVFKVKRRKNNYERRRREFSAIKRIEFTSVNKSEIFREYLNYKIITRNYSNNKYLVEHFDAWFEESVVANQSGISLYIEMELCDKTLDGIINELTKDSKLKSTESLTTACYYIASQIFIQILKGVNHLHKQNPPLIHRDLKPANILLKKDEAKGFRIKIGDFGLVAVHMYFGQSHTSQRGTLKYMAPEAEYKEYDTKADIYSLGVIFKDLTDCKTDE